MLGDESAPVLSMAYTSVHLLKHQVYSGSIRPCLYSFVCPIHRGSASENTQNLLVHSCFTLLCLVYQVTNPPCS